MLHLTPGGLGQTAAGGPVPYVLTGETVSPTGKVLTQSPHRVTPPCPHFGTCGGCVLQHASDAFVADWKAEVVHDALTRSGLKAEIAGVVTSPIGSRRRAKLAGRRTKSGALVGFHARRTHQIVEIPECRVLHPSLLALVPALRDLTREIASRKGEVAYSVTTTANGPDLMIEGGKPLTAPLRQRLAALAEKLSLSRLTCGEEPIATRLPPVQRFGRAEVAPPPGAFLQATPEGEAALVDGVRAATSGARRMLDLFAGSGTFALSIAEAVEVQAVEASAPMLAALDRGWRHATGLKRVTTLRRDLFRDPLVGPELDGFDVAVVDPPRAGARAQVEALAASGIRRVVMVSCAPATFAPDARRLVDAGFSMGPVTVVDQFRWSPHVELISAFTRS
ncbi:class I SAM-dependent RNA methyltransferase [Histidinibacterium lentulum]|uniref:Class I SAM-dependent RNA methyltransferase n=1 Tax=Histidinibacterium lentulum TaxID=2480588 RepID=A0A3N2R721_9RHOB|nr:class I SAM-dependent RNA methyltransferase [Histidinibacterium lentulum]